MALCGIIIVLRLEENPMFFPGDFMFAPIERSYSPPRSVSDHHLSEPDLDSPSIVSGHDSMRESLPSDFDAKLHIRKKYPHLKSTLYCLISLTSKPFISPVHLQVHQPINDETRDDLIAILRENYPSSPISLEIDSPRSISRSSDFGCMGTHRSEGEECKGDADKNDCCIIS